MTSLPTPNEQADEELDKIIKRMVDRFLGWRLPDDFQPDAGISFKPTYTGWQGKEVNHDPVGTNLFTATQAEAMVRYILSDEIAQHTKAAVEAQAFPFGPTYDFLYNNHKDVLEELDAHLAELAAAQKDTK